MKMAGVHDLQSEGVEMEMRMAGVRCQRCHGCRCGQSQGVREEVEMELEVEMAGVRCQSCHECQCGLSQGVRE